MTFLRLALALLVTPLALPASGLAEPIETSKIITALSGDFNGDGAPDLAMVVETEPTDPMDIHFFLGDKEHNSLRPVEIVHGQIDAEWNGYDRPGYENSDTEPELTILPNGSIRLHLPALPQGSERTDQTLVIAYRDGDFIVAGFAYRSEDFQQDSVASACDLNVLTGKGASSRKQPDGTTRHRAVSVAGRTVALRDWNPGEAFSACGG